jgi:hypothetical protein
MCGEIRKSPDPLTAARWAIAYAKSFEAGDDFRRDGDPLPDDKLRRNIAGEFINDYVPANQRDAALSLLKTSPDPLDTTVSYWDEVIDQSANDSWSRIMAISGTKWHDTYDNYTDQRERLADVAEDRNRNND